MSNEPSMDTVSVNARERITRKTETWSFRDPLLFSAWMTHRLVPQPDIQTIRVGRGEIQFNPEFILGLSSDQLHDVLAFEATRILLGHPYARRLPDAELTYAASNLAVQECLQSDLPIPRAHELLGDQGASHQYMEFYYRELSGLQQTEPGQQDPPEQADDGTGGSGSSGGSDSRNADDETSDGDDDADVSEQADGSDDSAGSDDSGDDQSPESEGGRNDAGVNENANQESGDQSQQDPCSDGLQEYSNAAQVGLENTQDWGEDEFRRQDAHALVQDTACSGQWGSLSGQSRVQLTEQHGVLLANQNALRSFGRQIRSAKRQLTRTKPSRRYGFDYLGSKYTWTTRLLFAIDVSGSMTESEISKGFTVLKKVLQQEFESVDVVLFDAQLQGAPVTFRRARKSLQVQGRGGTDFNPVIHYIDQNRSYDGLIIFTDGLAPVPSKPENKRTRICWLLKDVISHSQIDPEFRSLGITTFLH